MCCVCVDCVPVCVDIGLCVCARPCRWICAFVYVRYSFKQAYLSVITSRIHVRVGLRIVTIYKRINR